MTSYPKLNHESLDAYQAAIEFLALVARLPEQFPRGYGPVADQLRRAALSIPLNIEEGYGKRGSEEGKTLLHRIVSMLVEMVG